MQDWYEQRLLETKNTKRIIDLQKWSWIEKAKEIVSRFYELRNKDETNT
jgi:hypothetical protein